MRAEKTGDFLERGIEDALRRAGCYFARQVTIGATIYGGKYRADFVVRNLAQYPRGLVIESKWQSSEGSADEKFPYLLANITRCGFPAIVIVAGGGCRSGAREWLLRQRGEHLVEVLSLEQFYKWIQKQPTTKGSDLYGELTR